MRFAVLVALFALACASPPPPFATPVIQVEALPRLGDVLPDPGPVRAGVLVSPSQTYPSYDTFIDGIRYTLGIDREEHRVRYVGTNEKKFVCPEGLKVGARLEDVMRAAGEGVTVRREPGWGEFVQLPSGWKAFIGDNKRVVFFFLRD